MPIVGKWVNRPQTKDKAEMDAKTKEFQAAVAVTGVKLGGNVAKMEVHDPESAFW